MELLRVSEDIVPVSESKAQASDWLKRIAESGQPVVSTQNGKAAGVLLSPRAFDELMERARVVSAIEEGIADGEAGRKRPHAEVATEMRSRFRKRPKK